MRKIIILITVLLILTGCSSVRVVGVTPYELEKTTEQNNRNKLDVDFKFSGYDVIIEGTQYMTFDATVKNISDKPVEIVPEKIYYIPVIKGKDGENIELERGEIESEAKIIKTVSKEIKYYSKRAKSNEVSGWDSFRGLLVDVNYLTFGKERQKLKDEYDEEMEDKDQKRKEAIGQKNKYLQRIDSRKDIFLRKGVLNPNEQISGKVYFRRDIDAEILNVYFPIENNEYLFKFKLRLKQ